MFSLFRSFPRIKDIPIQVEDVLPPSPILPGQQTPTAHAHAAAAAAATPRASTSSVFHDGGARRYAWPIKEDPGARRPRFVAKTSFQEVRYRRNHARGEAERTVGEGVHAQGMAPRPVDFATVDLKRGTKGHRETSRPGSAASVNRYSLLDGSGSVPGENEWPHGVPKNVDFDAASFVDLTSPPPLLVRKATYSSLPPSPSALSNVDFGVDISGPHSVIEAPSYLGKYDQDAFTQALQKVLDIKQDADHDARDRKFRAASLPPEDVATERAEPEFRPAVERTPSHHFIKTLPLSRTASGKGPAPVLEHGKSQPSDGQKALEERGTWQPLWQMITDEMNVEQNRLFVIEGKW